MTTLCHSFHSFQRFFFLSPNFLFVYIDLPLLYLIVYTSGFHNLSCSCVFILPVCLYRISYFIFLFIGSFAYLFWSHFVFPAIILSLYPVFIYLHFHFYIFVSQYLSFLPIFSRLLSAHFPNLSSVFCSYILPSSFSFIINSQQF